MPPKKRHIVLLADSVDSAKKKAKKARNTTTAAKLRSKQEKKTTKPVTSAKSAFDRVKEQLQVLADGTLELKKSDFGGLGLFAKKVYRKGEPITEYYGEKVTQKEAKTRNSSHIRRHMAQRFVVDGLFMADGTPITDPEKQLHNHGVGAYANHSADGQNADFASVDSPSNEARMQSFLNGAAYTLDPEQRITYICATKTIQQGEEILLNYGLSYWQNSATKENK